MRALALFAVVGCSSDFRVLIDAYPAEVELGAIMLVSGGDVVTISELERATLGTFVFEIEKRDADEVIFVGYRAADLPGVGDVIRPAEEGEPRLPAPLYAAAGDWTGQRRPMLSRPAEALPPLTSGSSLGCPSLASDSPSVMRCSIRSCRPVLSERSCRFEIDAQTCGLDTAAGRIDPDGSILFEPADALGQCAEATPGPLEARAFDCIKEMLGCRLSIYSERTPLLLGSQRIAVADAVETLERFTGYYERLGDVVWAGDRMAVLVHQNPDSTACSTSPPSELHFFDLEGARVGTATVAPCTWAIAAGSDRIVAAEGGDAALSLYDLAGKRLARRPMTPADGFPAALAIDGELVISAWVEVGAPNQIAFHSLDALQPSGGFATDVNDIRDLEALDEDRLIALDGEQSTVIIYGVDGTRLGSSPINEAAPAVTDVMFLRERGELLVTAGGTGSAGVYSMDIDLISDRRSAPSPETDAQAHVASVWSADRSRVLVSMRDRNNSRGLAALYDLESGLVVPGSTDLGSGPSRSSAIDPLGRVWISMAWSGELAIVGAR